MVHVNEKDLELILAALGIAARIWREAPGEHPDVSEKLKDVWRANAKRAIELYRELKK